MLTKWNNFSWIKNQLLNFYTFCFYATISKSIYFCTAANIFKFDLCSKFKDHYFGLSYGVQHF